MKKKRHHPCARIADDLIRGIHSIMREDKHDYFHFMAGDIDSEGL